MERWQHNLEHGCIVLLYHPCLSSKDQAEVISLVSNCLKKYVSSPSLLISPSHPVTLVAWGCFKQFSRQIYPAFSLVKLTHYCALIGRKLKR